MDLCFDSTVWKRMAKIAPPGSREHASLRRLVLLGIMREHEGKTLTCAVLMGHAYTLLGPHSFGDDPEQSFWRDIQALRRAGFNLRFIRAGSQPGYCYSSQLDPIQRMREQISRLHPLQMAAWRRMTPAMRLALADQLFVEAREAARRDERRRRPHLSEQEIQQRVLRRMHGAGLEEKLGTDDA
ncbi:MAG: hypothetical protein JW850_23555 [Thermoflexales bacterium]|nr:hypothetical protein [Thermoflexales bacterium]